MPESFRPDASLGNSLQYSRAMEKTPIADVTDSVVDKFKTALGIEFTSMSDQGKDLIRRILTNRSWNLLEGKDDPEKYVDLVDSTVNLVFPMMKADMMGASQFIMGTPMIIGPSSPGVQLYGEGGVQDSPAAAAIARATTDPVRAALAENEIQFMNFMTQRIDHFKSEAAQIGSEEFRSKYGMGPAEWAVQIVGYADVEWIFRQNITNTKNYALRRLDEIVAEERGATLPDINYSLGHSLSIWGSLDDTGGMASF